MKSKICAFLALVFLLAVFAVPASAEEGVSTDITAPTDVPKVIITLENSDNLNRKEYIDCTVRIIDKEGGSFELIEDTGSSVKIRGNSTAIGEKKPYNIKFSEKTDVLGMGKAKKWCLLSNCYEKTLIRNKTVLDFAEHTNLEYTAESVYVDVYMKDKYGETFLGSYQLTESVGVGSSRVDLDIEDNEFLVERDFRIDEELYSFKTSRYGIGFSVNEPELKDITDEQKGFVVNFFNNAEDAIATKDINEISKYFDIDTMVDFYIVNEIFKSTDVHQSSTRVYIQDGLIHGGPLWDFDLASGNINPKFNSWYCNAGGKGTKSGNSWEGIYAGADTGFGKWFAYLMLCPDFAEKVKARYVELYPYIENIYADNDVDGDGDIDQNYIDRTVTEYAPTFHRNYTLARWKLDKAYSEAVEARGVPYERIPERTYKENLEYFRRWVKSRNDWLMKHWGLTAPETGSVGVVYDSEVGLNVGDAKPMELVNIAPASSYVITSENGVTSKYTAKLNDGKSAGIEAVMAEGAWYGFSADADGNGNGNIDSTISSHDNAYGVITFDMGKKLPVEKVRIHVCNAPNYKVKYPWGVYAIVSDDPNVFAKTNRNEAMAKGVGGYANDNNTDFWIELDIDGEVGQYVQFQLGMAADWCFVNEIQIMTDKAALGVKDESESMPESSEESADSVAEEDDNTPGFLLPVLVSVGVIAVVAVVLVVVKRKKSK